MNFSFYRVWTVVLRYWYFNLRTLSSFAEFLYWPLVDILIFGFIGTSLTSTQTENLVTNLMTGMVLWMVLFRCNLEISRNALQELWDENLINFFATPLSTSEWLAGLMFKGLLTISFTILYGWLIVYLFFGQNIFAIGPIFLVFTFLLALSGWIVGFFAAGCLIVWGQKVDILVWSLSWLFAPMSSVYYPLEILPWPMQMIGKCLPMTYAFQAMRAKIYANTIDYHAIAISFVLNVIYLMGAYAFFNMMLKKSKNNGLINT